MNVYCPNCKKKLVNLTPHLTRNHSYWCDDCDMYITIIEENKKCLITREIKAGDKFRHFKGNIYEVIAVATHTETMDKLVIYNVLIVRRYLLDLTKCLYLKLIKKNIQMQHRDTDLKK